MEINSPTKFPNSSFKDPNLNIMLADQVLKMAHDRLTGFTPAATANTGCVLCTTAKFKSAAW